MTTIAEALSELVNTATPRAAIDALRRHADLLLTGEALDLLDSNLARHRDDVQAQAIFGLRRRAIVAARERGLEAGVAELYRPDAAVQEAVLELVHAADYSGMIEQL